MLPSGTNLMIGAHKVFPNFLAIAGQAASRITLCLPVERKGPFCSIPPVGTTTWVYPLAMRSRISIQVNSSVQRDFPASMGLDDESIFCKRCSCSLSPEV